MIPQYIFVDGKFDKIVWNKVAREAEVINLNKEERVENEINQDDDKKAS